MPNIPPPPPPNRPAQPSQQQRSQQSFSSSMFSFNSPDRPDFSYDYDPNLPPIVGISYGTDTKHIEIPIRLTTGGPDTVSFQQQQPANPSNLNNPSNRQDGGWGRSMGNGVNYSSLRSVNEEYPFQTTPQPTFQTTPQPTFQTTLQPFQTTTPQAPFQPIKSSEIDAQIEFLKVELERLHRIKGNILRILKKYSRNSEKQTTLRAKLSILLLEEAYLASLYTDLVHV